MSLIVMARLVVLAVEAPHLVDKLLVELAQQAKDTQVGAMEVIQHPHTLQVVVAGLGVLVKMLLAHRHRVMAAWVSHHQLQEHPFITLEAGEAELLLVALGAVAVTAAAEVVLDLEMAHRVQPTQAAAGAAAGAEVQVVVQIVDGVEHTAQHLCAAVEVVQVSPTKAPAHLAMGHAATFAGVARARLINGCVIGLVARVPEF